MKESFRLGRIAGIPVGVNWTIGLIAMLLVSALAGTVLPLAAPGLTTTAYVTVGVAVAVGFFGSIVAHELGHSVVAIRRGIPVDGITLWLLGGVARLRREPTDARTELMVAAAGPATSVLLAVGFGVVAIGLDRAGFGLSAAAVGWLASINIILAVFNLVPAAPLDGGRILAGVLWLAHGDRDRAKWTATSAGRGLGVLMVVGSVWALWADAGVGLWPLLLGMFILSAANGERAVIEARRRLDGLMVRDVMSPLPFPMAVSSMSRTVRADALVSDVLAGLDRHDVLVLDDDGRVIGSFGIAELARLRHAGPRTRA
jgi:Zn-dependent protease